MKEERILIHPLTIYREQILDVLLSLLLEQKEQEVVFLQRAEVIEVMNIQTELMLIPLNI